MNWKLTKGKIAASLVVGVILGFLYTLMNIECLNPATGTVGCASYEYFTYSIIPFVIVTIIIYVVYSLIQKKT